MTVSDALRIQQYLLGLIPSIIDLILKTPTVWSEFLHIFSEFLI